MSLDFKLKNAGGFEQWCRTVTERGAQLLTDDLLETENDDAPDPCLTIDRPALLKDDASTQEIALWEARERQFILIHTRVQQLLDYMVQTLEPTLYERVITTYSLKKRTPTSLYRAVKKTLNPSSKSAETDLQTRLARLERSVKTIDIDIWLNSWIQVEAIAKANKYIWANDIIDRFHASLGHRSVFFATSFAALIWMGSITLPQLAEQYRLCEAKLKRFEYVGAQELENVFNPPVSLASVNQSNQKTERKQVDKKQDDKNDISSRCLCGIKYHSLKDCYLFNPKARPNTWTDRRSFASRKRLFNLVAEPGKRKKLEKELGHRLPFEILEKPAEESSSAVDTPNHVDINENYITDSQTSFDRSESVFFVPKFMVNIVSMDRIKDQMLIWDHSENWLTHWNASRTPAVKIWNQYNQNFIAKTAIPPCQTKLVTDIPESISIDLVLQNSSHAIKVSTVRKISSSDVVIMHRRLGHPETNTIKKLDNSVVGVKITGSFNGICEGCLLAKSKRIISRIPADRGKDYWSRMHVDLIVFSKAWNGENYAIHAYDAKGQGHMVDTISSKDQLTLCRSVLNMIRKLQKEGRNIEYLHSDNEKGFGNKFKQMLKDNGIKFEPTVPYSPEQNGFAEISGNRICVVARALKIHSGLPGELWPELVHSAVYLLNRTPTRGLNWLTPFEKYTGKKPDISNLKIIGCRAFVHIPRQKRLASEKLAERAWIGYLIGFEAHNIWRIWHPKSSEVVRVRDVVFQEDQLYRDDINESESPIEINKFSNMTGPSIDNIIDNPSISRLSLIQDSENTALKQEYISAADKNSSGTLESEKDTYNIPGNFSPEIKKNNSANLAPKANEISADLDQSNIISGKRLRKLKFDSSAAVYVEPEEDYGVNSGQPFFSCLASAMTTDHLAGKLHRFDENSDDNIDIEHSHRKLSEDPNSWKDMQKHPDCKQFMIAAHEEFQGLQDRQAWDVIDINDVPETTQIFPMRWVFVTKRDGDGSLTKHKARIVDRGDLDKTPYNRDEIYSHTLALQHFRSLMSYINHEDLETLSFDAVQAFVNAKRDRPIYCYMPEGFRQRGKVLRVYQALYGHRQSPKDWFKCYTDALKSLNFRSMEEVPCTWIHESGIILFFYVDDSIMAFPKNYKSLAFGIQESLCKLFPIKKLGEAKSFLGLNIYRDREKRKMWIVQNGYIDRIAKSYNLQASVRNISPLAPDYDMSPNTDTKLSADIIQNFQRKVGSAIYASICTRPDIALAVSMCADHLVNPAIRHLHAITNILQYLVNTKHYGLLYDDSLTKNMEIHRDVLFMASDASFGDAEGRKSSQGFVAFLYGGPVLWQANKQRSVTTSTTEAELVALSAAARELIALERFLNYVTKDRNLRMTLLCDNQQTVKMLTQNTPLLTTKLRHIDIHQHWLREKLIRDKDNKLELIWVPTSQMPADGLTKRLHIAKHHEFVKQIGIEDTTPHDFY